ncbi:hypothetical protein IMZ29_12680 [Achromobacter sp. GG226]|uniref:hypothetical protein n=1 Tax=Verticiella alkaliphila TaxID=2779529 RepID=UPI001C0BB6A7|nr:hypothetical protein [Verticiella sp. GG226]MBU4611352.1 hypothetical protein [Verticiella sp. GG226]
MLTDFVTRIEAGADASLPELPAGTRIYLFPDADYPGLESAVVAALDLERRQPLGLVPGDDKHRLFTRLQRGSIATAKVSATQTARAGLDIDVHMEDFGGGRAPDPQELLPTRPPRRTELVHFEGRTPDRTRVRDWARQLLAKAGEAENRGEDLREFARDQHAEIEAFERTLPPAEGERFRDALHEEVHQLDDVPAPVFWMLGETEPNAPERKGGGRWWRWAIIVLVAVALYSWLLG